MEIEETEFAEFLSPKFYCECCDYKCSYLCDWNRHISTRKHSLSNNGNFLEIEETKLVNFGKRFGCECGKHYASKSGLWKHKKKCSPSHVDENIPKITTQMFYDVLKQNNELQQKIIELAKEKSTTTISNCNNKTFNLQVFLNDTCKDALNISDFVNQIKLTINDLEETGKLGYVNGISRVVINNLNNTNITQRPIHCSDSKRETLYIKDDGKWLKEDEGKPILTKAIKQIANKNIQQITEWQRLNPQYADPESKENDKYIQIVINSMSGSSKEECEKNYEKIVKNIVKESIIDKKIL